jgi:hypothetical protein
MSSKNGDKSRFHRQRKQKLARRASTAKIATEKASTPKSSK